MDTDTDTENMYIDTVIRNPTKHSRDLDAQFTLEQIVVPAGSQAILNID